MQWAVSTNNLCKSYGEHQVLHDLQLRVPYGAVYGFVGANGAGKTTAIRILLGLAAATSGTAEVLGTPRGTLPPTPMSGISYLPDVPNISPWWGATDALISLARLENIPADVAAQRSSDLLDLVGLRHALGKVGAFSRGMKQRLGIAAALMSAPKLLILDEPTSALDPMGRADVLAIIRELQTQATVLFSSHILADVEKVSSHVGILHRGHLVAQGAMAEVLDTLGDHSTQMVLTTAQEYIPAIKRAVQAIDPTADFQAQRQGLERCYEILTSKRDGE